MTQQYSIKKLRTYGTAIIFLLSCHISVFAQSDSLPFKERLMLGWRPGWAYIKTFEPFPSEETHTVLLLESYLDAGFYFHKKLMIGVRGGYSFQAKGEELAQYPDTYTLGYFLRYSPKRYSGKKGKEINTCKKCATVKTMPHVQIGHHLSNNQIQDGKNIALDHLGVHRIRAEGGICIRLKNNLFLTYALGLQFSTNTDLQWKRFSSIDLNYYPGYKKRPENQNRPDCNSTMLGGILSCIDAKKKEFNSKDLILGTSLTYIWDDSRKAGETGKFEEYSWNINATKMLARRFRAGISGIYISTKSQSEKNDYFLVGGIAQYEPFLFEKHHLLFETGLMTGNYCPCEPENPYRENGIFYFNGGMSYELKIYKELFLDLGFNFYQPINDIKGKYSYTQYIVGLNYHIKKR